MPADEAAEVAAAPAEFVTARRGRSSARVTFDKENEPPPAAAAADKPAGVQLARVALSSSHARGRPASHAADARARTRAAQATTPSAAEERAGQSVRRHSWESVLDTYLKHSGDTPPQHMRCALDVAGHRGCHAA